MLSVRDLLDTDTISVNMSGIPAMTDRHCNCLCYVIGCKLLLRVVPYPICSIIFSLYGNLLSF